MYRWIPLTSGIKEPAEPWISGRKLSLRYDVRLTSPWTIDGVFHLGNPVTPSSRTKALRVVAWSAAPRLSSRRRLIIYSHLLAKSKKEHCSARSAVNDPCKASWTGSSSRRHHRPREEAPASRKAGYEREILSENII